MTISRLSKRKTFPRQNSGLAAGPAKMSAMLMLKEKASTVLEADFFSSLQILLKRFDRHGLSWRMSRASSVRTEGLPLSQLSTNLKRSGIWASGLRVTLSARAFPTIAKEFSLSDLIDRRFPINSILTAANCLGIIRREERFGRKLDPVFMESLSQTLRLWSSVAEALGTPKQQAIAPRYAPKLESIKAVTATDQYYVARNLTWTECEKLMGFPDGWTVDAGDSSAML